MPKLNKLCSYICIINRKMEVKAKSVTYREIQREGLSRHFPASWERPPVSAVSLSPPQQPFGGPRTLAGQWSS